MLDNATKLTHDFLLNRLGYNPKLSTTEENFLFDDYYLNTCAYINEHHFTKPSIDTVEKILNGQYFPADRVYSIICSIGSTELRKDLFKLAMAKQLIYDLENGRTSMIKDEQTYAICPEFKQNLSMLGLIQTGMFSRIGS